MGNLQHVYNCGGHEGVWVPFFIPLGQTEPACFMCEIDRLRNAIGWVKEHANRYVTEHEELSHVFFEELERRISPNLGGLPLLTFCERYGAHFEDDRGVCLTCKTTAAERERKAAG